MAVLKAVHTYGEAAGTDHDATVSITTGDYVFAWVTFRQTTSFAASADATLPAWLTRVANMTTTSSGAQRMDAELWVGRAPSDITTLSFTVAGTDPRLTTLQTTVFSNVLDPDEEIAYGPTNSPDPYTGFDLARDAFVVFNSFNSLYSFFSGAIGTSAGGDTISYATPNNTTATVSVRAVGPGDTGSIARGTPISGGGVVGVALRLYAEPDLNPVVADAGDRLRSNISETTGSLLEAVDVRAVDASVSEAYTYAQRLDAATLTNLREVLRKRDSAAVDLAYYPRPRQNVAMENQYSGATLLSRLSTFFPPRIFGTCTDLSVTGVDADGRATATQIITHVFSKWALVADWFTYETVPDLRVRMPQADTPSAYTTGVGVATSDVIAIPQAGNDRKDALTILKELLSPFPGTVVRQNSTGKLEIVPSYGPDADATPFLTLDSRDLYSVSIGEPDPFGIVNRCTVSSNGYEVTENTETMQPAYFQVGSILNFGKANWYTPPVDRVNLQPPEGTGTIYQEDNLTQASPFSAQTPGLWPISTSALPAGEGISLQNAALASMVTAAYKSYNDTTLSDSGTATVTLTQTSVPFDGVWRDTIRLDIAGANIYATFACRWNAARQGIEFRFGTANKLEQNCFIPPCEAFVFEVTLNDSSTAFTNTATRTATFGIVDDPTTPTGDDDWLNAADGGNAIAESQVEYGILERSISIQGYSFTAAQLEQIARAYVIQNLTPKVIRELDVAALSGYRVTFDSIGRQIQLPNGERGNLIGVAYSDDFVTNNVRKTAQVEVRNPLAAGALPELTLYHLAESGDYWIAEGSGSSGGPIDREENTAASPLAGGGVGGSTTPSTDTPTGSSSTSVSTATYPITASTTTGDWYVDPAAGDDGNAGTSSGAAFLTLEAALAVASDGDTILVRAGTLTPTSRYSRTTPWATGLNVWNYGTERPVIDASSLAGGSAGRVVRLAGDREHWKGFEVINSADIPVYIEGSENTVEDFWVHDNAREAIYIFGSGAADNIVQDSVCWRNGLVSDSGTNAPDGIVCTANSGTVTSGHAIVRCLVANASDDAFDLFRGNDCIIWDCVAFEAGLHHSAGNQGGDGNGFKAGGSGAGVGANTIRGCLAVNCRVQGFEPNLSPVPCTFEFNTASGNQYGFGLGTEGHTFDSNLAFGNSTLNSWTGTATETLNSWNLGTGDPLFVNPAGFDWSLAAGSPAIGEGTGGENLGASDLALELALEWCGVV